MKKLLPLISAAAITAASLTSQYCCAASAGKYIPKLSMSIVSAEGLNQPGIGYIYVNSNKKPDTFPKLKVDLNYVDESMRTGQLYVKWNTADEKITIGNTISPIAAGYPIPYSIYNIDNDYVYKFDTQSDCWTVSFRTTTDKPLKRDNSASDVLHLGQFEMNIDSSISSETGLHKVEYRTTEDNKRCNALIRPDAGESYDVFFTGAYASGVTVAVSDRELGDVNKDDKYSTADASDILKMCAMLAKGNESELTPEYKIAGDLDFNEKITVADAALALKYCAYLSKDGNTDTIYEQLLKNSK